MPEVADDGAKYPTLLPNPMAHGEFDHGNASLSATIKLDSCRNLIV